MHPTLPGPDGLPRCHWCASAPEFLAYHDHEWGFPVADDHRLFECLCLESFQSGLSWRTILAKREHFRAAFHRFDFDRIARFTPADVERLLLDKGIVRHRGKIQAVVHNARCARERVAQDGSLAAYFWRHAPEGAADPEPASARSLALSRDLKRLGWKFVGPTTVHAFMQSAGIFNPHAEGCVVRTGARRARQLFKRP